MTYYGFAWSFVLMNGVEKTFNNTSATEKQAKELRAKYIAILNEASVYPATKKKMFKICDGIGVRGGRVDSYYFSDVKEKQ